MVIASAAAMHKEEPKQDTGKTIIDSTGNLVRVDAPPPLIDIVEDPIDRLIAKEDGWIYKKEGLRSSTKRMEDYIAVFFLFFIFFPPFFPCFFSDFFSFSLGILNNTNHGNQWN